MQANSMFQVKTKTIFWSPRLSPIIVHQQEPFAYWWVKLQQIPQKLRIQQVLQYL